MRYEIYIKRNRIFGVIAAIALGVGLCTSAGGQTAPLQRPNERDKAVAVFGPDAVKRREALAVITPEKRDLSTAAARGPSNDMFEAAEVIAGTSWAVRGTNEGAGIEDGEPASCTNCKTVWYRWTAPANLSMTFETYGVGLTDTLLEVYVGNSVGSLKPIAKNDNITPNLDLHSRVTFAADNGGTYYLRIYGADGATGPFNFKWEINGAESWKQFNFDGADGSKASDYAVFRLQAGVWWIYGSKSGNVITQKWGLVTDHLVPVDYDGDSNADIAVWRPATEPRPTDPPPGFWVMRSSDGSSFMQPWGIKTDYPVQGDFDGDDRGDMTVFRGSTGTFWTLRSSDSSIESVQWGKNGDFTVPADYDGDGSTDYAVQRSIDGAGVFLIRRSSDLTSIAIPFGLGNDMVIPGDYDHDGKADLCVHRYTNDTFYWLRSSDGQVGSIQWGVWGDQLVAGDYTGSPGSDITIWRPAEGNFYTYDPLDSSITVFHWGQQGDAPVGRSTVH